MKSDPVTWGGSDPVASGSNGMVSSSGGRVKVWIDQDLCTGDAMCVEHAPEVFTILEDGIAYCVQDGKVFNDPGGPAELATVPYNAEERVVHAAAECPGECIFVEIEPTN